MGISYYGKVVGVWGLGRTDGRAEINSLPECGDDTQNPYEAGSDFVTPDTPFRLGSVSKPIAFAIGREVVRQEWIDTFGYEPTQEEIESLKLVGSLIDMPGDLPEIYARAIDVPVNLGVEDNRADFDWLSVTLGHILSHRSGLPRSAPDPITNTIPALRGYSPTVEANFQADQANLEAIYGAGTISNARDTIATAAGENADNIYVLPQINLVEILAMVAGRELANKPENWMYTYSNTGPGFVVAIAEEMSGVPFAAATGDPNSHENTLLDQFFEHYVGVETTGQSGIFHSQQVWPKPAGDPETRPRDWDND